ncbi:VOC family protein [Croceibacterium sp. LX-88]|jgi:predicted lactoylglutathione lyase|uniref:VOC family protein n=1 Tax=Croceibacterium selenioxidans TaxID=2838833 RepID=A0ABS5W3I4_9SPHN|nr:VOC family protein [Croceibacterium selenioxidans]MBT2134315.1 VOC family protein [Croceibacterium selenioxidans]
MAKMIFVNLPVTDLPASMRFYEAIGFTNNPQFTNDQAAAMMWSDTIVAMLLRHDFWKTFTSKQIPDAHQSAQVLLALSQDSKEEVEAIVAKAVAAGGKADPTPKQDMGFMYGRSFEDPDGHIWENAYMNMAEVPEHAGA